MDIDGKALANELHEEFRSFVERLNGRKPGLAVVLVGDNPASRLYVNGKVKACEKVGIVSFKHELESSISENELLQLIQQLNNNPTIDGILVQLPLPKHINNQLVTNAILPQKDVDGFHPVNLGKLMMGDPTGFVPCTPLGIQVMLKKNHVETNGKHAVVVGRSIIVGKPMASLLMQKSEGGNASVTVVHSRSKDIKLQCQNADILIAAVGVPKIIKAGMVKENSVVIDVGQNKIDASDIDRGYRIVGDVDYENVKEKCQLITPVPGGVGPMTIAMLLNNTIKSFCYLNNNLSKNVCLQDFSCY
ncbi:MAG: bifunctional methylenetetrahydrofolate dehydrogenase/methenyltetrahydrofolate cyclohydrolase FolD [Chlamydiota bacterium]